MAESSRRGNGKTAKRRKRGSLDRAQIIDAAMLIVQRDGLDALTMPRLAKEVNAGAMSLYTHVKNKDEIVLAIADRVLEEIPLESTVDEDLRRLLERHFHFFRERLLAYPVLPRLFASRGIASPRVFEILAHMLGELRRSGLNREAAVRTYYSLFAYTLGQVSWEAARSKASADDYALQWDRALARMSPEQVAVLGDLRETLVTVAGDEQFDFGLQRLLDAIFAP